jgi:hypothetical protein
MSWECPRTLLKKIGWVKVQTFFLGSGELEEASLGHLVYGMRNVSDIIH